MQKSYFPGGESRQFYGMIDSIETMSEGSRARISVALDAVGARFLEDSSRRSEVPFNQLALIRLVTTRRKFCELIGSDILPTEGSWVRLSIYTKRKNRPPIWIYSAEDDYFAEIRASLDSIEPIGEIDARPLNPVGAAIAPMARAKSSLKRFDLRLQPIAGKKSIKALLNTITAVQRAKVYDVGQASLSSVECIFKDGSEGKVFVDAGEPLPFHSKTAPKRAVPPFWGTRILILTHWDWDHVAAARYTHGGASHLQNAVWIAPPQSLGPNAFERIYRPHFDKGLVFLTSPGTSTIYSSCLKLIKGRGVDRNNSGIGVIAVARKGNERKRILFPGDATLGTTGLKIRGQLDGLVVPHHGAKTPSIVPTPRVRGSRAVVSSGQPNRYKHPNAKELKRYQRGGWLVCRTDRRLKKRGRNWAANDIDLL